MSDRPTIPAGASLEEARHWLLTEAKLGGVALAQTARDQVHRGEAHTSDVVSWLRDVVRAKAGSLQAAWAGLLLQRSDRLSRPAASRSFGACGSRSCFLQSEAVS